MPPTLGLPTSPPPGEGPIWGHRGDVGRAPFQGTGSVQTHVHPKRSNGGTQHDECRGHTLAHVCMQSGILHSDVSRLACALKPGARDHRNTGCESPEQNMRTALGCGSGQHMGSR